MRTSEVGRLFRDALKGWYDDNVPRLGASLSYYTLFAIGPVLIVAIGVAGLVFGRDAVRGEIVAQVDDLIGTEGAKAVQALLQGESNRTAGVLATILGSVTFVLAATGAFLELQTALNTIWRVKPKPGLRLREFLTQRLMSFGLVVAIGFLLLVSLAVSAVLIAFGSWLNARVPAISAIWQVVNILLSVAVTTVLFALVYKTLPDVRLRWSHVWVGAFLTALLFTLGKTLIGLYLGRSTTASTYGAAGSVIVILLWVYYSSQVVLFGAELTRAYTASLGPRPAPEPYATDDPKAVLRNT